MNTNRKFPLLFGVLLTFVLSTESISATLPQSDPGIRPLSRETILRHKTKLQRQFGRILDINDNPAKNARFYESIEKLELYNLGNKIQFEYPNVQNSSRFDFRCGRTDQDGRFEKYQKSALFVVSESGDQFAFVPPGPLDKEIKMRKFGTVRIHMENFPESLQSVTVSIVWKNSLAGTFTHDNRGSSDSWRLNPVFELISTISLNREMKTMELKVPPGEISVSAYTINQRRLISRMFRQELVGIPFHSKFPSVSNLHLVKSNETTNVSAKIGTIVIGQIRPSGPIPPDWSVSKNDKGDLSLHLSSKHTSTLSEYQNSDSKFTSYSNFLSTEKGRKRRSQFVENVPVLFNKDGYFASCVLPPGSYQFAPVRTFTSEINSSLTLRQVNQTRRNYHLRKRVSDKNPLAAEVPKEPTEVNTNGQLNIVDLGYVYIDDLPFKTRSFVSLIPLKKTFPARSTEHPNNPISDHSLTIRTDKPTEESESQKKNLAASNLETPEQKLKRDLEKFFESRFLKQHRVRRKQLQSMQAKLNSATKKLDDRYQNRQKIIQNRIRQIFDFHQKNDKWNLPATLQLEVEKWKKNQDSSSQNR